MPYDPMAVTIAADDAEALGWLLFESNTHARLKTPAGERLTEKLFAAQILAPESVPDNVARLGSTITYTELPRGTRRSVRVVTPLHADANEGRVSVLSPIGCALLGHGVGAVVDVHLPTGTSIQARLDEVEHAPALQADESPVA